MSGLTRPELIYALDIGIIGILLLISCVNNGTGTGWGI